MSHPPTNAPSLNWTTASYQDVAKLLILLLSLPMTAMRPMTRGRKYVNG